MGEQIKNTDFQMPENEVWLEAVNKEILRILSNSNDDFAALEVSKQTPQADIKKSYINKIKKIHPDKIQNDAPEIFDSANRALQVLNLAYGRLSNSKMKPLSQEATDADWEAAEVKKEAEFSEKYESFYANDLKFDHFDSKYKRVDDLPAEIQALFVDLPEGGFVRKTADKLHRDMTQAKEAEAEKESQIKNFVLKSLGAWENHIHQKTMSGLEEMAKRTVPEEENIKNMKNQIHDVVYVDMYEKMKADIKKLGLNGYLTKETLFNDKTVMSGVVEGIKLYIRYRHDSSNKFFQEGGTSHFFIEIATANDFIVDRKNLVNWIEKYDSVALDVTFLNAIVERTLDEYLEQRFL